MLLLLLILSSLLAYKWPAWIGDHVVGGSALLEDPFVATSSLTPQLVAVTMFAVGMLLTRDEIAQVGKRWPTVLGGTTVQFVSMPLLAFLFARLFGLTGVELVGVVMVGCVPGAMASNVLTIAAGGNGSYSISLTTMATLLSPLTVPLALSLTLRNSVSNSILILASWTLLKIVVLPVVAGFATMQILAATAPTGEDSPRVTGMRRLAGIAAHAAILWIIANVVGKNRDNLAQISLTLLLVLLLINICGYGAGLLGGRLMRLPVGMRRALTLEVGMQNAGLGVALASELFAESSGDGVAVAPAIYTFGCMLTGTVLAQWWSRRTETGD